MATRWNAVILLDEADIFLERRGDLDIVRNAMVGVFLRLLEYHNGVLFLTTNRVRHIDPAFNSRISITLSYDHLDFSTRLAIWRSLMQAAAIQDIDPATFAHHDLNGRQIKNVLRLAQTLALSRARPVQAADIVETLVLVLRSSQSAPPTPTASPYSRISSPFRRIFTSLPLNKLHRARSASPEDR